MIFGLILVVHLHKLNCMIRNRLTIALSVIAVGAIITVSSCTKLVNLLNTRLSMQTQSVNVTVPVIPDTSGMITVGPAYSRFDVDSFIKAQTASQFGAANIESVKLHSVVFTLNNADMANNFQNFKSVSASFYSNTNSTPYVVSIPNNPNTFASSLSLPVDTTVNLKAYIGNQFYYTISGEARHGTTKELDGTITFTFDLDVKAN